MAATIKDFASKALGVLEARLGDNAEVIATPAKEVVSTLGAQNTSGVLEGESVEFLKKEDYEANLNDTVKVVRTTSTTGRTFDNVYALVKRYYGTSAKRIGERYDFINIGNLVKRHVNIHDQRPNDEGKIVSGVTREIVPGKFNQDLEALKLPWSMLTEMLAGKTITAKRSSDKLWFQKFVNNKPVKDEYVEQSYMIYSFVK